MRCEVGHPVCLDAAKEYLETQLGQGVPVLNCLHPNCSNIYPGGEVLRFIDLNIFKGKPRDVLETMIERVGVKDLVELCPDCSEVIVCGPVEENSIVNCTNQNCKLVRLSIFHSPQVSAQFLRRHTTDIGHETGLKSYCRKCKKKPHVPLSCEANGNPVAFNYEAVAHTTRISIEEAITEAIDRKRVAVEFEGILDAALFKICGFVLSDPSCSFGLTANIPMWAGQTGLTNPTELLTVALGC